MEGECDVDVELFIEEIKGHRTIWDVRCEDFKDRAKKQSAWEKVCQSTFQDFETKSENERSIIVKKLALKWKNIKDNFARSLRKRTISGQPAKKYLYERHLSFLIESMALATTQSSAHNPSVDSPLSEPAENKRARSPLNDAVASSDPATPGPSPAPKKADSRRPKESSSVVDEPPSRHSLFFDSLIPAISNFTEDQTLQFRSEVIDLIRKIKGHNMVSTPDNDDKEEFHQNSRIEILYPDISCDVDFPERVTSNELNKPKNKIKTESPVDAFLAAIASSLKSLDQFNLILAKGKIFNIVQHYELQQLKSAHNPSSEFVVKSSLSTCSEEE